MTTLASYWCIVTFNGNETHWCAGMFSSMLNCLVSQVGERWPGLPREEKSAAHWIVTDKDKHGDGDTVIYDIIRSDDKPDPNHFHRSDGRVFDLRDIQLFNESLKGRPTVRPGFKEVPLTLTFR